MILLLILQFLVSLESTDNPVGLPLRPHEIVLVPRLKIAHRPPKSLFQSTPDQYGVIALADIVFVGVERCCGEHSGVIV